MRRATAPWLMLLCFVCGCDRQPATTATSKPTTGDVPSYICHRATGKIEIDGLPNDESWKHAESMSDFYDLLPDAPRPNLATRCKLLWDDQNLYVLAELDEPHLWATMTERASHLFQQNAFEVFLDPTSTGENYWELEINAINTIWDLQMSRPYDRGGKPVDGATLQHARTAVKAHGTVNDPRDEDKGWTVEMAIPLADLKPGTEVSPGKEWRFNLARVEWPLDHSTGEYERTASDPNWWSMSPMGRASLHVPIKFARLKFAD